MVINADPPDTARADSVARGLLGAIEGGLPLVPRPYREIADRLGIGEDEVIERLGRWLADGTIRRLGVVVRHRELGYRANAMVVWNVDDALAADSGRRLGGMPFVTLCYRRPRRPPDWPYNLYTMIHGRDRDHVLALVDELVAACGLENIDRAVLFSGRRFKQRGARYTPPAARAAAPDKPC